MHKYTKEQFPYRNPCQENPKKINTFGKKYGVRGDWIADHREINSLSPDFPRKQRERERDLIHRYFIESDRRSGAS
jgi:hypothetical protein